VSLEKRNGIAIKKRELLNAGDAVVIVIGSVSITT